jgi:hypothetical protein
VVLITPPPRDLFVFTTCDDFDHGMPKPTMGQVA